MDRRLFLLLFSCVMVAFSAVYLVSSVKSKSLVSPFIDDLLTKTEKSIFPLGKLDVPSKVIVATSPVPPVVQPKFCNWVPVLLYHHIQSMETAKKYNQEYLTVEPATFEEHLKRLKSKGYNFISAEELADSVSDEKSLPKNSIVLTFDDGYSNLAGDAFTLAKKYGAKMNIMIITSLVGKGGYLSWDQMQEMEKSKLVYFYNHTADHYALNYLNKDQIKYQALTAQNLLEEKLKRVPKILVYPMGFYNDLVISTLNEIGFNQAYGTESGTSQCDTNLMHLQRLRMGNTKIENYGF